MTSKTIIGVDLAKNVIQASVLSSVIRMLTVILLIIFTLPALAEEKPSLEAVYICSFSFPNNEGGDQSILEIDVIGEYAKGAGVVAGAKVEYYFKVIAYIEPYIHLVSPLGDGGTGICTLIDDKNNSGVFTVAALDLKGAKGVPATCLRK